METSKITTTISNSTSNFLKDINDVIAIIAGSILFLIVVIPTIIILLFDLKASFRHGIPYWIWDTISLHCSSGRNKYLLSIVCCYCAIYLTTMKTIEFHSHKGSSWNSIILFINIISFLSLLGVGIFETHPHPFDENERFLSILHIAFAAIFFCLNTIANILWTYKCIKNVSDKSKDISFLFHWILTHLSCIFFIFVLINSSINLWLLSSLKHPDWSEDQLNSRNGLKGLLAHLIIKRTDKLSYTNWCVLTEDSEPPSTEISRNNLAEINNSSRTYGTLEETQHVSARPILPQTRCNCLERRKIFILCISNYVLELLLILSSVLATLLQTSIEIPLIKWGITDASLHQDICWDEFN